MRFQLQADAPHIKLTQYTPGKVRGPSNLGITFLGIGTLIGNGTLPAIGQTAQATRWAQKLENKGTVFEARPTFAVGSTPACSNCSWPGPHFLCCLYDLLAVMKAPDHHVYLNSAAQWNIIWWTTFLENCNSLSLFHARQSRRHHLVVLDAGVAVYSDHSWFQLCWSGSPVQDESIMVKELVPVAIAAAVSGQHWVGSYATMNQLRSPLCYSLPKMPFLLWSRESAVHISGVQNKLADDLSCNCLSLFLQKAPTTQYELCRTKLRDPLFNPIDWTSQSWRGWFSAILNQV